MLGGGMSSLSVAARVTLYYECVVVPTTGPTGRDISERPALGVEFGIGPAQPRVPLGTLAVRYTHQAAKARANDTGANATGPALVATETSVLHGRSLLAQSKRLPT